MANVTIGAKYGTAPRNTWTGVEKIPLDVSGADGVGLASTLKTYVTTGLASTGQIREKLTGNRTYFVATTGNDTTGDGSSGTPWASPNKAWQYVCLNLDLGSQDVTINLADGTYTPTAANSPVVNLNNRAVNQFDQWSQRPVGGRVRFRGNAANRTLVKLSGSVVPTVYCYDVPIGPVTFEYMQVLNSSAEAFSLEGAGLVQLYNVDIGGSGSGLSQIAVIGNTSMQILGDYSILNGGADWHLNASQSAQIEQTATVHIPSSVTFAGGFATTRYNGFIGLLGTMNDLANFHGQPFISYGGEIDLQQHTLAQIPGDQVAYQYGGAVTGMAGSEGYNRNGGLSTEYTELAAPDTSDIVPESAAFFFNGLTHSVQGWYSDDGTVVQFIRERLQTNRTYYVRSGGADTHTGLTDVDADAWGTQAYAIDYITKRLDLAEFTVTLQVNSVTVLTYGSNQTLAKTGLPAATDLPSGKFAVFKNNTDSKVYGAYNDGGTVRTVEFAPYPGVVTTSRVLLTSNTSYYVATTGNDTTGDGSVGLPWKSPQKAYDYICRSVDLQGYTATINFAAGTYTPTVANTPILSIGSAPGTYSPFSSPVGGGVIRFLGQATRTLVRWDQTSASAGGLIYVNRPPPMHMEFESIQLFSSGGAGGGYLFQADANGSYFTFKSCDVGSCLNGHFYAGEFTQIVMLGTYSILGGGDGHLIAGNHGVIFGVPTSVSTPGSVTFSAVFQVTNSGYITTSHTLYSSGFANIHGARYDINAGSGINNISGALTALPGDATGGANPVGFTEGAYSHLTGFNIKAGLPTTAEIEPNCWSLFRNTTDGKMYLAVHDNNTGTIKKVELV